LKALANGLVGCDEASESAEELVGADTYQTSDRAGDGGNGRILIVDDQSENRRVLRRRLEREGYLVTEVSDGTSALELLEDERFDIMLLDMMMPGLDGYSTLIAVRKKSGLTNLPVLMISADEESSKVARCIEAGAEDYLPKPFDPTVLKARIRACIEKKRLRDRERDHMAKLEQTLVQLREAQSQLIVKEKMACLGALTAGIAHEIKNPLNFVVNFARLTSEFVHDLQSEMRNQPADHALIEDLFGDIQMNLGKISEHGKRADGIVRSMLAHSRGGSAQFEEIDLNALVRDGVELTFHGFRAKEMAFQGRIDYQLDPNLPRVWVLASEISQVVMNLAANGLYAAQRQRERKPELVPTLTITTRALPDSNVEIAVRDNGTGIPIDARSKVFQPFYTTKPTGVGTGLGLSISYQIVVDQHGGRLVLDSEEGKFTEFQVVLPAHRNRVHASP
jgi:two-component system, NtrC family, sensor kinase